MNMLVLCNNGDIVKVEADSMARECTGNQNAMLVMAYSKEGKVQHAESASTNDDALSLAQQWSDISGGVAAIAYQLK